VTPTDSALLRLRMTPREADKALEELHGLSHLPTAPGLGVTHPLQLDVLLQRPVVAEIPGREEAGVARRHPGRPPRVLALRNEPSATTRRLLRPRQPLGDLLGWRPFARLGELGCDPICDDVGKGVEKLLDDGGLLGALHAVGLNTSVGHGPRAHCRGRAPPRTSETTLVEMAVRDRVQANLGPVKPRRSGSPRKNVVAGARFALSCSRV